MRRYSPVRRLLVLSSKYGSGVFLMIILVVFFVLYGWINNTKSTTTSTFTTTTKEDLLDCHYYKNKTLSSDGSSDGGVIFSNGRNTLYPGQLPGYTGWARPEYTLARSFTIQSISNSDIIQVGKEFIITVQCQNCAGNTSRRNDDKDKDNEVNNESLFFLRAYGKSVVPGTVTKRSNDNNEHDESNTIYDIVFLFFDSGIYTIEVVLTFSNPPSIYKFPLEQEQEQGEEEPSYEGYLLPGFPLIVNVVIDQDDVQKEDVQGSSSSSSSSSSEKIQTQTQLDKAVVLPVVYCKSNDLIETSFNSAIKKARWIIIDQDMEKDYYSTTMNTTLISKLNYYDTNRNSIGINMEYKYNNNCLLIPEFAFDKNLHPNQRAFSKCYSDSVLRIQNKMLEKLLLKNGGIPSTNVTFQFHFLSLHGGYRRNQIIGPSNVTQFLSDIQKNDEVGIKVILFNTGLHDIHRLCGSEFSNERKEYLTTSSISSFSCVDEYKALLIDFVTVIQDFPAQLKVFQSTTAAWPKYGNWGIQWDHNGQRMPLVSDFSAVFNDIAYEVILDANNNYDGIDIMDGYWITYPRPDNREIGDIGNKLSHPGSEVVSAMSRKWATLILDRICT
ncbi:hypothetical protein FRACYDRAFT_235157 [Fragilariopsis cylindrus CCMP1102]|uniref:Uncharacterized protein n=1 Tax=Fragilariopsis cylindrus CCMP1102 TaxID=635003 RepID=A0A1E7FTN9_9STRA|nr:hypothetical protein FRACYDRAFT_235157 [Fragilariopsis cylindrus CCMP1102]|eukprot:OEU21532.1 hypothetical protein FRACYDRAFT_235157 [Fragilariopsis cylindrus CCMP1102]